MNFLAMLELWVRGELPGLNMLEAWASTSSLQPRDLCSLSLIGP